MATLDNPFKRVTAEKTQIRLLLTGAPGSGKTWGALKLATALAAGAPIAFLDTEGQSCKRYARDFEFDAAYLKSFNPENYIRAIEAAAQNGYAVLIIDSFSHAWNGTGGVLEIVDKAGGDYSGNKFAGWQKGRPAHRKLIETILHAGIHIIGTARSKPEWVMEANERGKMTPRKVGVGITQDGEFEYEFDIAAHVENISHTVRVSKSRCSALPEGTEFNDVSMLAEPLLSWVSEGETVTSPPVYFEPTIIEFPAQPRNDRNDRPERMNREAPPQFSQPQEKWPTINLVNTILRKVKAETKDDSLTLEDIAALAFIDEGEEANMGKWGEYATGKDAYDRIMIEWNKLSGAAPAQPAQSGFDLSKIQFDKVEHWSQALYDDLVKADIKGYSAPGHVFNTVMKKLIAPAGDLPATASYTDVLGGLIAYKTPAAKEPVDLAQEFPRQGKKSKAK